ncbi:hypothetical protein CEXT_147201 [Caerostris extrusa]|uniref:Uncharacterized protein n=1 Tax=Caerostris extrusa TaxID=172846 RepID=A0AAV4XZ14_CAEEX|nr:hypothetical protein CEXT_147201 [Caerostris extrusa]
MMSLYNAAILNRHSFGRYSYSTCSFRISRLIWLKCLFCARRFALFYDPHYGQLGKRALFPQNNIHCSWNGMRFDVFEGLLWLEYISKESATDYQAVLAVRSGS